MENTVLGARLKRIRQASGISQAEMANALGLKSQSGISKIEAGDRTISAPEFATWCAQCGTTTDAVLTGEPFVVNIVGGAA